MDCTDANGNDQFRLVGDAHGNMPETKWNIIANGYSKSGGPFQWFHRYIRKVIHICQINTYLYQIIKIFHHYRCPASNECSTVWTETDGWMRSGWNRAEPPSDGCCVDNKGNPLAEGLYCNPDCEREIQNDETATPSEAGFYFKFESDPDTGFPYGCPGLDGNKKWVPGKGD